MNDHAPCYFIYRIASEDSLIHAKAVDLGIANPEEDWDPESRTGYILPDGPRVRLREVRVEWVHHRFSDALEASVYAKEQSLRPFEGLEAIAIKMTQHTTFVYVDGCPPTLHVPFLITCDAFTVPGRRIVSGSLLQTDLRDNPDAVAYFQRCARRPAADRWDVLLRDTRPVKPVRYVADSWFPGTCLTRDGRSSQCVYRLIPEKPGFFELHLADGGLDLSEAARIVRSARLPSGEILTRAIVSIESVLE